MKKKIAHLTKLEGSEKIKFFIADLLKEGSFDECFEDADYVFHCASPFVMTVTDPQTQLVDPAVKGTLNVLNSCANAKKLKRVVLTSSVAAITDSPKGVLNEDVWNTKSDLNRNPYYYSKTLAEKQAWKFCNSTGTSSKKLNFDLVTINPFLIMGPAFDNVLGESAKVLKDILTGAYPAVLGLEFAIVDVRDVARAHILAAETPEASGRFMCVEHVISMKDLCAWLTTNYPDECSKVPTASLDCGFGNALMKGAAIFQEKGVSDFLQTNIGKKIVVDNSKIKKGLNFTFTPLDVTLKDTIANLKEKGHLPSK